MLKFCYDNFLNIFYKKRFRDFLVPYIKRMELHKIPKIPKKYECEICNVICSHKGDFNKHMLTSKHKKNAYGNNGNSMEIINIPNTQNFCECGKKYATKSGLWKHKQNCNFQKQIQQPIAIDMSYNIILEIVKQNQEFKEIIMEQHKHMIETNIENQKLQQQLLDIAKEGKNITNNTTNNTNNQFNLQFFLNEQCKDALNIDDFVNQIKLQLSDLDMIGRVGYVEGISKIFLRNLKELDVFKRPIHCSDLKRETLYVKDKDAWEKENMENTKIKQAIKGIEHKNIKQIPFWVKENPTAEDTETKKHMEYQNILLEAMGGSTLENDDKKREKIVRNIAKEVVIDKNK